MVQIKRQIVSANARNKVTYGSGNGKKTVTVHQTGNTSKGADAQAHANLQSKGNSRSASWHYSVDDKEAIQSFEDDAQCWAAGDGRGPGNLHSIHIELCINSDGDYNKTLENGAELVKHLLDKHGLSINAVKQHHDWSGKNCPAQIRSNKNGISWFDFISMVDGSKISVAPKRQTKSSTTKTSNKGVVWVGTDDKGKRVESIYKGSDGLNFYDGPRWNNPTGTFGYGMGWKVDNMYRVDGSLMYRVQNSKGDLYYITASTKYVKVIGNKSVSKPKKSIKQMATEVIRGDHGSGHENRRKSLGISKSEYEKVRAEVNRRL